MVNKLGMFFLYFLFFILALMFFTPKSSVYYFLEKELKPYGVIISGEEVLDRGLSLEISGANVSFGKIQSATISEIKVNLFAFYNTVDFKDIVLSSLVESFVPLHVETAEITYTVFSPLHVSAISKGEFGEAYVKANLLDRSVHVRLVPSEIMLKSHQATLREFVKTESGEYEYDQTF